MIEAAFGFAGKKRNAQVERALYVRVALLEHGGCAGNVKAADGDGDAALTKRRGDVEGARKLVRLHADQHDHAGVGLFDQTDDLRRANVCVGFVKGVDVELNVVAERLLLGAFQRQPVQDGQRV